MHARPNILLISVDSLRADHLGCYGYHRETSPRIDALSRQGALVERLFCPGIPTYPSYTTLYTGQHPLTHGILAHGGQAKLSKQAPFLPEILVEAGYTTCAFDNLIRGRPWFGRGYEYYIDPSVRHTVLTVAVTSEDLNGGAIPWTPITARWTATGSIPSAPSPGTPGCGPQTGSSPTPSTSLPSTTRRSATSTMGSPSWWGPSSTSGSASGYLSYDPPTTERASPSTGSTSS